MISNSRPLTELEQETIDRLMMCRSRAMLILLRKALKSYSIPEQFELDWDCKLLKVMGNMSGVVFKSDAAMTAFYLRYDT